MKESIQPGSMVCTDGWEGYTPLNKIGYVHNVIRKESHIGDNLLPLANRVISLLKRWLLGTHQGSFRSSHLDYYLDEFTFRFNRRTSKSRGKLFYRLAQQSIEVSPVLVKDILGGTTNKKQNAILLQHTFHLNLFCHHSTHSIIESQYRFTVSGSGQRIYW